MAEEQKKKKTITRKTTTTISPCGGSAKTKTTINLPLSNPDAIGPNARHPVPHSWVTPCTPAEEQKNYKNKN